MHLHAESLVSAPLADVFAFFADASNLQTLTPPWLHFAITSQPPVEIRPGTRIEYRLRLHGLPVRWVSEIPVFDPPFRFVDEQRRGPYRRWVHTHTFHEAVGGGEGATSLAATSGEHRDPRGSTAIVDDIEFEVPLPWLAGPFVARELVRIFTFRHHALLEAFNQPRPWPDPQVIIH
jgi:ligand-binding SRPBCC domain-containing protein